MTRLSKLADARESLKRNLFIQLQILCANKQHDLRNYIEDYDNFNPEDLYLLLDTHQRVAELNKLPIANTELVTKSLTQAFISYQAKIGRLEHSRDAQKADMGNELFWGEKNLGKTFVIGGMALIAAPALFLSEIVLLTVATIAGVAAGGVALYFGVSFLLHHQQVAKKQRELDKDFLAQVDGITTEYLHDIATIVNGTEKVARSLEVAHPGIAFFPSAPSLPPAYAAKQQEQADPDQVVLEPVSVIH